MADYSEIPQGAIDLLLANAHSPPIPQHLGPPLLHRFEWPANRNASDVFW